MIENKLDVNEFIEQYVNTDDDNDAVNLLYENTKIYHVCDDASGDIFFKFHNNKYYAWSEENKSLSNISKAQFFEHVGEEYVTTTKLTDKIRKMKILEYISDQPCVVDDQDTPARMKAVDYNVEKTKFTEKKIVTLEAPCNSVSLEIKGVRVLIDKNEIVLIEGEEGKHENLRIKY